MAAIQVEFLGRNHWPVREKVVGQGKPLHRVLEVDPGKKTDLEQALGIGLEHLLDRSLDSLCMSVDPGTMSQEPGLEVDLGWGQVLETDPNQLVEFDQVLVVGSVAKAGADPE
jgi:hypothetical protein